MFELIDEYKWDKERKLLTEERHKVSGLKNVAHFKLSHAAPSIATHYHSNIYEFHCLTKGRRENFVNDESYIVNGNELFITFPSEHHKIGSDFQWPCEFYTFQICIDEESSSTILGLNQSYSASLRYIIENNTERHFKVDQFDITLLVKAFDLFSENTTSSIMRGTQYLCCFLFNIPNLKKIDKRRVDDINPSIKKAIDYISENITESLSLSGLSAMTGYSITQFKVNFKKETGISPSEYINLKKIQSSINYLLYTDIPISDIAMKLGFSTSNYFASVFRKFTTFSPKQYRKKSLENQDKSQTD